MPTLYVENVPSDLYAALRARAKAKRSSIAAETIEILRRNVPTAADLRRRQKAWEAFLRLQQRTPPQPGPGPSGVDLIREGREEADRRHS
ncbi:MAG: FitA-like ribbon-helix-helix domain-containing protein [Terriglobales bacterium]